MPRLVQCAEFEELAMLYAAGELGDEDRAAADAHAQECAACAATLASELAWRDAWAAKEPASDKLDRSELLPRKMSLGLFRWLPISDLIA